MLMNFPPILSLEDSFDPFLRNLVCCRPQCGHCFGELELPFRLGSPPKRPKDDAQFTISLSVGRAAKYEDIKVLVTDRKLNISGKVREKVNHGLNENYFEREYKLPTDLVMESMKCELTPEGQYKVTFDRRVPEPRKLYEDLSTESEYRVKMWFPGFNSQDLNVKLVDRTLLVEATRDSSELNEKSGVDFSGYASKSIHIGEDVELDNIRVKSLEDGGLEIFAPRDAKKVRQFERKLLVEKPQ